MPNKPKDVIIVGAGIVGCLTGYLLAKEGVQVTIIEKDSVASHASGFAFGEMGALEGTGIPDPLLDFSLWSNRKHKQLYEELKETSGIDSHFRIGDRLTLSFDDSSAEHAKRNLEWKSPIPDFDTYWVDSKQARDIEPRVNPEALGGVLVKGAGSTEPYRYTLAAAQAGEKMGVTMILRNVTGLISSHGVCTGVKFDGGELNSESVVLAMGPWANVASEWCKFEIPISPLKGQILRLNLPGDPLKCSIHYGGSYVGSKPDGLVWAGTTEEEAGFDEHITPEGRNKVMEDLLQMAPSLNVSELVHQTACLRPVSSDGLPVIGKVPGWNNVYLGTGAGRKGILWSTGMSYGLKDIILGNPAEVPGLAFLDPIRFVTA